MPIQERWIDPETILEGDIVRIVPLHTDHFGALKTIAVDQKIWEHYPIAMSTPQEVEGELQIALQERNKGTQVPFAVILKSHNKIIGSTRFLDVQQKHKKLEIGWTWLHPDYWGTFVNIECKLLLLQFCFETIGAMRVQFRTDSNNIRSRTAIEKIGATFEGLLRRDVIRHNGTTRDTAQFSIIDAEWIATKQRLVDRSEKMKSKDSI